MAPRGGVWWGVGRGVGRVVGITVCMAARGQCGARGKCAVEMPGVVAVGAVGGRSNWSWNQLWS